MMLSIPLTLTSLLLPTVSSLTPRSSPFDPPTLLVSNLGAFLSSNTYLPGHVAFTVIDPRPDYYLNTTCYASTPNPHFEDTWQRCNDNPDDDLQFWFTEDYLALWRPWLVDPKDPFVLLSQGIQASSIVLVLI
jgi:hypothetical protein